MLDTTSEQVKKADFCFKRTSDKGFIGIVNINSDRGKLLLNEDVWVNNMQEFMQKLEEKEKRMSHLKKMLEDLATVPYELLKGGEPRIWSKVYHREFSKEDVENEIDKLEEEINQLKKEKKAVKIIQIRMRDNIAFVEMEYVN